VPCDQAGESCPCSAACVPGSANGSCICTIRTRRTVREHRTDAHPRR
jgi:hypothetical protein